MNILVVDDHKLFREGLLTVLKRVYDFEVILEAADGLQTLNLAAVEDIDLALIDFHLPDITGTALIHELKALVPEIPIIIMSGAEDPAMIRSVMEAGASGFIPKSMEPEDLIDGINVVLKGGIYLPPNMRDKLNRNELDLTSGQGVDYSELVYLAQVTQKIISTNDWSIRAKHHSSNRAGIIEGFNQLLDKMETHYNQLKDHAFHDFLTDLPNRRLFDDRLENAVYHARRKNNKIALLTLDVDKFKQVNDELGHDQGDELLKVIAVRLKLATRDVDTVSRFGGDEFAIILTEVNNIETVEIIVTRMLKLLSESVYLGKQLYTPSMSIGGVFFEGDISTEVLFKKADEALYQVKNNGRNGFKVCEIYSSKSSKSHFK